jgi:hypothetical protein
MSLVRAFLLWAFLLFWWHCRRENGNFKKRSSSSYSLLFCNMLFISINIFYICYSALRLMIFHQNQWFHWSTVICQKFWEMSKKSLYNQTKNFFFQNIIVKSFLDRIKQIAYQNIRNCLYFVCLFAHYVYMSGVYLYIIFPWLLIFRIYF